MSRIRPELLRGLIVLGLFFVLIVSTDLIAPYSFEQNGYTVIDLRRAVENPSPLDGHKVTSTATITGIMYFHPYTFIFVEEDIPLYYRGLLRDLANLTVSDTIIFRGTFHISPNNLTSNYIVIREVYVLDYSSSLIRSVPGIILFVVMFFMIFTFDLKRVAFVLRRRD
jgi:hypothetical protein